MRPTSSALIVRPLPSISSAVPPAAVRQPRRIVGQDLFHSLLRTERKRAARARQTIVVLLITPDRSTVDDSLFVWQPVVDVLEAAARDTDVIGWFAERRVLGVIQTEITAVTSAGPRALEHRIRRAIGARSDTAGAVQIRVHRIAQDVAAAAAPPLDSPKQIGRAIKRVVDVLGSIALLILLSPLFLLIALLVKSRSSGPLLFGQTRIGEKMKPFTMLKFRTMYTGADQTLHREYVTQFIKSGGQGLQSGPTGLFKITADPRVTPIGRVLRKTSLDELPQLWNVLRGEMSLVGPRPALPYEVEQYQAWHCRRLVDAKPGITGLWQVVGRSRTTFDEMVRLDLRYAKTCSFWTDVKILLATPRAVISGKGAC